MTAFASQLQRLFYSVAIDMAMREIARSLPDDFKVDSV
jgi:hypothetical protein